MLMNRSSFMNKALFVHRAKMRQMSHQKRSIGCSVMVAINGIMLHALA
jgi:hypothetical protein